jgi:hypothetical protein
MGVLKIKVRMMLRKRWSKGKQKEESKYMMFG